MSRTVTFHRLAGLEVQEGAAYYGDVGDGLGAAFIDEIERAARALMEHPESGPVVRDPVRKKVIRRFPYTLFYTVRPGEVRVLAVGHQKRRPFYWARRR